MGLRNRETIFLRHLDRRKDSKSIANLTLIHHHTSTSYSRVRIRPYTSRNQNGMTRLPNTPLVQENRQKQIHMIRYTQDASPEDFNSTRTDKQAINTSSTAMPSILKVFQVFQCSVMPSLQNKGIGTHKNCTLSCLNATTKVLDHPTEDSNTNSLI